MLLFLKKNLEFTIFCEQMAMCENWQLFVYDGRHNHAIGVYSHGHAQAAKLTEEQLIQIEQFRKSHVPPHNILRFFREQNVGCAIRYNMPLLEVVGMTPTDRECGLMPVIGEVFSTAYHMLCRRHINQNVLAKLTELIKNEEVASRHLAFKKIWSEITRAAGIYDDPKNKCSHYLRTSHGLPYACKLITREMRRLAKGVLNPVLPEDPGVTLTSPPEITVTKGRKKTDSTKRDKLHWEHVSIAHRKIQKSSGSVSGSGTGSESFPVRVQGWDPVGEGDRHELLRKGAEDATVAENVIGDGNCCYWVVADFAFGDEHQWPEVRRGMLYELEHSTNLYVNLVGSEERVNELVHRINWLVDGPAPYAHWFETPDSLYIVANAFNLCVILIAQLSSTTVLPLYSYSDRPEGTLVIGFLTEERHFIQLNNMCPIPLLHVQWIHHRSEWVSNWADSYQHRIADWNARVARNRK
ncbi:hypothetical protein M9H77_13755 [Catharanthus roseus]|uniref:Uncharacterized protein n=1 Tax=Catharanthus roseus TaxID=4058 RepID=A0ACC0BLC4_CATRO|nr:hypothetical protein M9H77_13755 [Catharanthus roseus]